jgi:adenylosuccinate synthase
MKTAACKGVAPECVDRLARIETQLENIADTLKENTASLREHMARTAIMEQRQAAYEVALKEFAETNKKVVESLGELKIVKSVASAIWKPAVLIGGAAAMLALGAKGDVILGLLKALVGVAP